MRKFFVLFIILSGFSVHLFSQASSSAGATVVEPITITKTADMNFRSVAIIFAGTVEMSPRGVPPGIPTIMLPVTRAHLLPLPLLLEVQPLMPLP